VHDFEGIGKVGALGPYLVAISTTSGTAAEVTSNAVVVDSSRHVKMILMDSALIPEMAVNDPELMLGLPVAVTHAVEAYVSIAAHPLTDPTALESIRLISEWLPQGRGYFAQAWRTGCGRGRYCRLDRASSKRSRHRMRAASRQ